MFRFTLEKFLIKNALARKNYVINNNRTKTATGGHV